MLDQDDLRAYLFVLGFHPIPFPNKTVGCLIRLEEQLGHLPGEEHQITYDLMKFRERLNGYLPHGHHFLAEVTRQLADRLSPYLKYGENS